MLRLYKLIVGIAFVFCSSGVYAEMACLISSDEHTHLQSDQCESIGELSMSTAVFSLANIALEDKEIIWSEPECEKNNMTCHLLIDAEVKKKLCAVVLSKGMVSQTACATAMYHQW